MVSQNNTGQPAAAASNEPLLTPEQIQAEMQGQEDIWLEDKPLQRELPAPKPFPIDALGPILASAARKAMQVVQAPDAICGQSFLAAACLTVQAYVNVSVDGRTSPASEFFISIAESGERKTELDKIALAPHRVFEEELHSRYDGDLIEYEFSQAAFTKAKESATGQKTIGLDAKKQALKELGPPPRPPLAPIMMTEEPTYEGMVKALQVGQPSIGIFSDEGGRMLGGHAMNKENQLKTAAGLSNVWDGKPISRMRGGDGNSKLYGRRVSLHLMIQPKLASLLLANDTLISQGLPSRCLVSYPDSTAGKRSYNPVNLTDAAEIQAYNRRVLEILRKPQPVAEGKDNELKPRNLHLTAEAKSVWIEFHDCVEIELRKGGKYSQIRGFANKAPEHALRLAGVLAAFDNVDCLEIGLEYLQAGIRLVQYYLSEAIRLFEAAAVDPKLTLAGTLLEWLQKRGKSVISLVEIYRNGPNSVRVAAKARELMVVLAQHGKARPSAATIEFEQHVRHDCWEIRPALLGAANTVNPANVLRSDSQNSQGSQLQHYDENTCHTETMGKDIFADP